MDRLIASDDVAFTEYLVLALTIGDETAGLAYEDQSRRQIPRLQGPFPIAVEPSRCDPGKVECGRTKTSDASDVFLHGADFFSRQADIAMPMTPNSTVAIPSGRPWIRNEVNRQPPNTSD